MRRGMLPLIAVLSFGLLYAVVTPRADDPAFGLGFFERDPKIAAVTRRVTATADTLRALQLAGDREAAALRIAAAPAPRAPISVVADAAVPVGYANSLRDALAAELAGIEVRVPLRLIIVADSSPLREGFAHYARPQADGEACTIVRQYSGRRGSQSSYIPRREWRLVGVCGFYARHGMPGAGMTQWLDATGAGPAMVDSSTSRGDVAPRESIAGGTVVQLAPVLACASGVDEACLDALYPAALRRPSLRLGAERWPQVWRHRAITWDDFPSNAVARLRQELGPERFERIWTSALAPDAAYAEVTGEPFATFARPYVQEFTAPRTRGPLRAGLPLALSLSLLVATGWLAIARVPRMRS